MSFRLLLHPRMEGHRNMAVDEALAESAASGSGPSVRLYGFSPPTLSLGRFQRVAGSIDRRALEADGVTLVRRPTGGHAVLHDNELTYAVAISRADAAGLAGSERKRAVYAWIARLLLEGLANLGVRARVNAAQLGAADNPDCFGAAGEYEIAAEGGAKLIGSAQTATRDYVLQHGSIPIDNPGRRVFRWLRIEPPADFRDPSCLAEQAGRPLQFTEVRDAFAAAPRSCWGAVDASLTAAEEARARDLVASRYDTDEWNLKW